MLPAVSLCASWLTIAGLLLQTGPTGTFRASAELVSLPVVVSRHGALVDDLTSEDFEVLENGQRQTVVSFARGTSPLYLGLLLDKSVSMERDLAAASNAAVRLLNSVTGARDVTFVEFERRVTLDRYEPGVYEQLVERIREPRAGSGTALYDAVGRYVESADGREGTHVLVLFSDGGDSTSELTLAALMRALRRGPVVLYAIGYVEHQSGTARLAQQGLLQRLARETGGEAFFPSNARDFERISSIIASEVRGRYTLGYMPSDTRHDGRFRRVQVRVTRPDLKDSTVRTRSGYLAPGN